MVRLGRLLVALLSLASPAAAQAPSAAESPVVVKAPGVSEAVPSAKAPSIAEAAPQAKAPSVVDAATSAKAPSVAEAVPSAKAPSATVAAPPALAPSATVAAPLAPAPTANELVTQREAPVIVLNRPITTLRSRLLGIDPAERARRASARVSDLLEHEGPRHVSVLSQPQGNVLFIDDNLAFALTPDDPDKLGGETLEEATESALQALNRIAAETREAHNRDRLLHALGRTAVATLALLAAIFVVLRGRRALVHRLTRVLKERAAQVQSAAGSVLDISRLFAFSRWLVHAFGSGLLLVLAYEWASYSLNQFPYTRPWGEKLNEYLLGVALGILSSILHALPDLLVAVVIFFLARGLIGLGRPFFDNVERNRVNLGWLDPETARATRRIFGLLVWTFAVVMAYPYLPGSGSEAFKGVTVLFGLMATLGGSSLFAQAASGLILMYSRTVRVGEYVRIGEQEGTVTELGTFTTRVRTGLGEELTLPNALVLGTVTKNYSRPTKGHGFYLDTTVTIGYDAPWRQVQALLIEGALRTPGIVNTPPPRVYATALSDFYVEYRLVCQCTLESPGSRAHALHELHAAVLDTFNEHGVQIMSPHYLGDPAERKVVPKASWYAEPAAPPKAPPTKGGPARPDDG